MTTLLIIGRPIDYPRVSPEQAGQVDRRTLEDEFFAVHVRRAPTLTLQFSSRLAQSRGHPGRVRAPLAAAAVLRDRATIRVNVLGLLLHRDASSATAWHTIGYCASVAQHIDPQPLGPGKVTLIWGDQPCGSRWLGEAIEKKDGWKMRVVFVEQNGAPIVREVHLTPINRRRIPFGGLSARRLRSVTWKRAFDEIRKNAIRNLRPVELELPDFRGLLKEHDLRRRPGRRGYGDVFYAELAFSYERALVSGANAPVRDLAKQYSLSESQMRTLLHRARKRGFLTSAGRGSIGGQATEKARRTLDEARSKENQD